jgi:hypothetical protein
MAQQEVGTILFNVKTAGDKFIDLSTALGVANYKQFHQFSKSGRPLCYRATIECLKGATALPVATAPKSYPVVNSLVQTSAGWNSQRSRAGQKKKHMSPYGQRFRVGLVDDAVDNDGIAELFIQPYGWLTYSDGLGTTFTDTDNEAGDSVSYQMISEVTTMVVPGDTQDDEPTEEPAVILSGATAASTTRFRTVREWTENRQGLAVEPDEGREINTTNKMARMFSDAQPETDEILVELDEYQEFRPYDQRSQYQYQMWGSIAKNTGAGERSIITVEAPCGLVQIGALGSDSSLKTAASDQYLITVHAIYEM